MYGEESPLRTGLKSVKGWHYAMKSYILRASKNSENIATPFYTGLFSGISEGVRMDCPFVTGLKNHPFPDIMSSKPQPDHSPCTTNYLHQPLLYRVKKAKRRWQNVRKTERRGNSTPFSTGLGINTFSERMSGRRRKNKGNPFYTGLKNEG